jgi:hypothetical protein
MRPIRLLIAAAAITMVLGAVSAPSASAENPLYCNNAYFLNEGCPPPTIRGIHHKNEARNESGYCVTVQSWVSGYGYTTPFTECGGRVAAQVITVRAEGFPKCWNSTNNLSLLHCRYELYGTFPVETP